MTEPVRWRCGRCGGHLAWTASTVGCQPCATKVVLPTSAQPADTDNVRPLVRTR